MEEEKKEVPAKDQPEGASGVNKAVQDPLETMQEWSRGVFYTSDGKILATTFDVDLNEIQDLLTAFDDYDNAFRFGLDIDKTHYDVHRFFDHLIYGRNGDSKVGEGICICKVTITKGKKKTKKKQKDEEGKSQEKCIYGLITYGFPTLSSRAIPQLLEFSKKNVEPLLQ